MRGSSYLLQQVETGFPEALSLSSRKGTVMVSRESGGGKERRIISNGRHSKGGNQNKRRSSMREQNFKNAAKSEYAGGLTVSQDEPEKACFMPFFRREQALLWSLYCQTPLSGSLVATFSEHTKFCTWQCPPPIKTASVPHSRYNSVTWRTMKVPGLSEVSVDYRSHRLCRWPDFKSSASLWPSVSSSVKWKH